MDGPAEAPKGRRPLHAHRQSRSRREKRDGGRSLARVRGQTRGSGGWSHGSTRSNGGGWTGGHNYGGHSYGGHSYGGWNGGGWHGDPDRFSGSRWHGGGSFGYGRPGFYHGYHGDHGYRIEEWRHIHPDWNGRYYFHGGAYFYDPFFEYPAVIDNEWDSIAAISGGVALLGALDDDPTLFFAGTAGALYSLYRYDEDRYSDYPAYRLRAAYFSRPYFWRDGVRFDREIVRRDGREYYRFVRHY